MDGKQYHTTRGSTRYGHRDEHTVRAKRTKMTRRRAAAETHPETPLRGP